MQGKTRKQNIPYTQVANSLLCDPALSLKAKGLFAYLYSKPDDWDFSAHRIAYETRDERKAILGAMRELMEAGYVTRRKLGNGRVEYHIGERYQVIHSPKSQNGTQGEPKSQNGTVPKRHGAESGPINKKEDNTNKEVKDKGDISQRGYIDAERGVYVSP
jgi:hypothetical protein